MVTTQIVGPTASHVADRDEQFLPGGRNDHSPDAVLAQAHLPAQELGVLRHLVQCPPGRPISALELDHYPGAVAVSGRSSYSAEQASLGGCSSVAAWTAARGAVSAYP